MALINKNVCNSDDEDDLESLRLAALQSLRPKSTNYNEAKPTDILVKPQYIYKQSFGAAQTTRHHARGFRNTSGRPGRNGLSSRVRTNPNLISIKTFDPNESKEDKESVSTEVPKLTLPQDRYHKPLSSSNITKECTNDKFDRYNNSDDSESDLDDQVTKPFKRERKCSLEQLMDELENEISVLDNKINLKDECKGTGNNNGNDSTNSQVSRESVNVENTNNDDTLIITECKQELEQEDKICPYQDNMEVNTNQQLLLPVKEDHKKPNDRSPYLSPSYHRSSQNKEKSRSKSPTSQQYKSPYHSPRRSRSPIRKVRYSPGLYSRPLSPLNLNAEVLNTITMAPLSPRSAAFVMRNREILARRQMSPRRSSSRGSSCRSISPKRNKISPRRRSRSPRKSPISPRKRSKSRSPNQKSLSPRNNQRRTTSYKSNRLLPNSYITKRHSNSPLSKQSVHKRLGSRPTSRTTSPHGDHDRKADGKRRRTSRSMSLSLSPSPDRNYPKKPLNDSTGYINLDMKRSRDKNRRDSPNSLNQTRATSTNKPEEIATDPILEARKRKFQSTAQIETNGIIKLNINKRSDMSDDDTKGESPLNEIKMNELDSELDDMDEEIDDGILDLNPSLDDLWSDEESDSENEGRFKSKPSSENKKITILPFTKLMNKSTPSNTRLAKVDMQNHRRSTRRQKNYTRRRSCSPVKTNSNKSDSKPASRSQDIISVSAHQKQQSIDKIEEIKSKTKPVIDKDRLNLLQNENKKGKTINEQKEQNTGNLKVPKVTHPDKDTQRKVKLSKNEDSKPTKSFQEKKAEPEILMQNDDDPSLNKSDDGDLRTELSRRRAERMSKKGSLAESLPTRLLKTALQEVVPKRLTASKTSKGNGSSADRRVLVLKRLASRTASELDPANKVSNHEVKLPIHMRLGLSNSTDLSLDEIVRPDRRKRSRSGRRRKGTAVQV